MVVAAPFAVEALWWHVVQRRVGRRPSPLQACAPGQRRQPKEAGAHRAPQLAPREEQRSDGPQDMGSRLSTASAGRQMLLRDAPPQWRRVGSQGSDDQAHVAEARSLRSSPSLRTRPGLLQPPFRTYLPADCCHRPSQSSLRLHFGRPKIIPTPPCAAPANADLEFPCASVAP